MFFALSAIRYTCSVSGGGVGLSGGVVGGGVGVTVPGAVVVGVGVGEVIGGTDGVIDGDGDGDADGDGEGDFDGSGEGVSIQSWKMFVGQPIVGAGKALSGSASSLCTLSMTIRQIWQAGLL